jgi:hypothetical protein
MRVWRMDPMDRGERERFLTLPFDLYRDDPQWVPPLAMDIRRMLNPRRHPFYAHSQAAFFLAETAPGRTAGRLAVLDNRNFNAHKGTKTAFFYLFECVNDHQVASALFEAGFGWARDRGLDEILGPKGFTALDGLGMLARGFEHRPAFGQPYNPPYYPHLAELVGLETERELISGYLGADTRFPERFHRVADKVRRRRGLHIARFTRRRDLRAFVPKLKDLYNSALGETEWTVPLTQDEADALASQLLWFADPKLIKVVVKDEEPVGFLFAYPDISAGLQRTGGRLFPFGWIHLLREARRTEWVNINGAGILERYRGLGGTAILFSEVEKSIREGGFQHADLVQIGTENETMLREMRGLGVEPYKLHRLYRRSL